MKILLVTEKCSQSVAERDGGARVVETMQRVFGNSLSIMQFGAKGDLSATWCFNYPYHLADRFERRLVNASFIAEQVKAVEESFTHVVFIHVSMQFGLTHLPLRKEIQVWTFPMFLTPSYVLSGEIVPESYVEAEHLTLACSKNILTPSHLEKRQLIELYSIPEKHIHVVPRGVNTQLLDPKVRFLSGPPRFCSIGSIKPQKNTLGLIELFAKVAAKFSGATLQVIGAVQNSSYFARVQLEVQRLGLAHAVEFTGYIPPHRMSVVIQEAHLHLSASTCETFGRSIFETLASGLPNIGRKTGNAAAEFLDSLPYARFVDDHEEALHLIEEMLESLPTLSSMALEIGNLYDDEMLSRLLMAKICNSGPLAISDFDGTLYHKEDPEKTLRCFEDFQKFPLRVICSARPIDDLLDQLRFYNLKVDWIIGSSGSVVADGDGKLLWLFPLKLDDILYLEKLIPKSKRIEMKGEVLQIAAPAERLPNLFGWRVEVYQDTAFISHWQASKLRAVHRLLRYINWSGQVHAFGDGPYDMELLTYFDGTLVTPTSNKLQKKEVRYV